MSNASYEWIMDESGRDCLIVGNFNAGQVSFQEDGRYKAVTNCAGGFYGWALEYFDSQDEAYDWVVDTWMQYEAGRPKNY